ncbi:MAG TPA: hypothetical protein DCP90_07365 [Clostridiales bacterium]|nr:MAG: hypothetical protein A2Y22_01760 [Clostridiales bacterium GWD2_32_59]HAN10416.1 hypothetical protein [Clostridiales bacterium]
MAEQQQQKTKFNNRSSNADLGSIFLRVIITAIVLMATAFLTPGFTIEGVWALLVAAVAIIAIDYLVEQFTGIDASPMGKGIIGFVIAAAILYFVQFIVPGYNVSAIGAIIGALIIGVVNAIIPGRVM